MFTAQPKKAMTHSSTANKGYNWVESREKLRKEDVRPLIKHYEFQLIDCAHNAQAGGPRYWQRAMCETVLLIIERTLSDAVRART